ncbi:MAG: TonB-dependent receptor domain-containing protein, partial [Gemmatimonadales bacterium]
PRDSSPWVLPHNSGESLDLAGKVTLPIGDRHTLRLFGLRSANQSLLYDPAYKYESSLAPGQRVTGNLLSAHLSNAIPIGERTLILDLHTGYYTREFIRGTVTEPVDYSFGAFTGQSFQFVGEEIARAQNTAAASGPIAGFEVPGLSDRTPWGVPAFFLGGASRGNIAWNRFRELRGQVDATIGVNTNIDLYAGGLVAGQRVETFQRVQGYSPVGPGVPPATASDFSPALSAAYLESQVRLGEVALTGGFRLEHFSGGEELTADTALEGRFGPRTTWNPRIAVSTVLEGATLVVSIGRFSQPPDFQYLVDAAFDDTMRTGRFRRGNPNLGFETSTQYEVSLRGRPSPGVVLRAGLYYKRLNGLVASVPLGLDPDSTFFGLTDYGTSRGLEIQVERERRDGWGARLIYTLAKSTATSTSAFLLNSFPHIDPANGDTLFPGRVDFPLDYDRRHALTAILQGGLEEDAGPRIAGVRPLSGLEGA